MANDSRVQRAAEHISATELVGEGKWAHYDDAMGRWYVVTAGELESLCDYLDDDDEQVSRDAYSHWCAGTSAKEMPEGWGPGTTYAIECRHASGSSHWAVEPECNDFATRDEAEEVMTSLEEEDEDGNELEYRVVEVVS